MIFKTKESKKIHKETSTQPIQTVRKGDNLVFEYNKLHKREELVCLTDELETAMRYIRKGWAKKRVLSKIVLFAPEISLIDLSNAFVIQENGGAKKHLALYKAIKYLQTNGLLAAIIETLTDVNFFVIHGESIELEVRVAFHIRELEIRSKIIKAIKKTNIYKDALKELDKANFTERNVNVLKQNIPNEKDKFRKIKDLYAVVMGKNINIQQNIYGIADKLPSSDYYLLIPHSGFKFIDEFTTKFGEDKILFYEKHFCSDGDFWIKRKDIAGKKVLIVDSSYSGETLAWTKNIVEKEGGIPTVVAVWPKSKIAVKKSDYIFFVDKIIKSDSVNLKNEFWAEHLYKKIIFSS